VPLVCWHWLSWWTLIFAIPIVVMSNWGWWFREKKQGEDGSHLVWDPYLDDLFFYVAQPVGIAMGILVLVFLAARHAA